MCEENGEAMPLKLHSVRMLKQSSQASWRSFESFSCWWFNPTGWVELCFPVLTSQSNRANLVFSSFILFFWLWPSRAIDLYFSPLYQWNSHYFVGFVKEKYTAFASLWLKLEHRYLKATPMHGKTLFLYTNEEGCVFVIWDNDVAIDVSQEIRLIEHLQESFYFVS